MGLINGSLPGFVGGVSQQDATVRLPTQLEDAINCWFDPARGNGKRPPAEFVMTLASDIPATAAFHSIVRDAREHYIVCIYGGTVRVFDHVTGKEYVVANTADAAYLDAGAARPCDTFRMTTVADTTFITNRDRVVALDTSKTPGFLAGSVQTFEDLPKSAVPGNLYAVTGDPNNGFDQFYVQCQSSQVFNEVSKPGEYGTLDKTTMPHLLKRVPDPVNPDGFYFTFGPMDWDQRAAGDAKSNRTPSFVGQTIANIVFHRERLGLLSVENVALSEVGHPFNFWRTTVTQLLPSDPIDVAVQMNEVATLQHAIPYQRVLMLFSNLGQYQLSGSEQQGLSPQTVRIDPITNYKNSELVAPVTAGDSVVYLTEHGSYAAAREYFVQVDGVTNDAAEISAHVPAYIPAPSRTMASCPEASAIFVAAEAAAEQFSVFQYRWDGDSQSQAAWGKWQISGVGKVIHAYPVENYLYAVAQLPEGGAGLLRFDLSAAPTMAEVSPTYNVHLDRRTIVTGTYNALGNYTDFALPYALSSLTGVQGIKSVDWPTPGAFLDLTGATMANGGQSIRLSGDLGGKRVVFGLKYDHSFTLSQTFKRDRNNLAVLIGRLQLRSLTLAFAGTGYFKVMVGRKARPDGVEAVVPALLSTYTGRTTGDAAFLLNAPTLASGSFKVPVLTRADLARITVLNDSPYPGWFQSAQWEAMFTSRSPA